jgi:zinc transport system substrate-binding protein
VTSHAAFGYLAARYRLEQVPISGLAPDAEPSPSQIKAVADAVRTHGVTTIFFEPLVSPKAAQSLAADLGVGTAVLDPVEGLAHPAAADYFSVMRANLAALRKALSCR